MKGIDELLGSENTWQTTMGKWFAGERVVFRGKDLHHELGHMSWLELYLFSITGKEYTRAQLTVLNAIWTFTSFPDPRLWNNRVTALAGTARSTPTLALSAGMAMSEATIFGHKPSVRAISFIKKAKRLCDEGQDIKAIIEMELQDRRVIGGFGRPLYRSDERISHLLRVVKENDMDKGPHVSLAFEVERQLLAGRWRMRMNIAGFGAAIAADLDFSPREFHLFKVPCFIAGMVPCFVEAQQKTEGSFFPFRCSTIEYKGVARKKWVEEK